VVERLLRQGQRVAYVSDAGTPAISDPGARLVAAVQAAGLRTVPLPGASSVTAALSVAGIAWPMRRAAVSCSPASCLQQGGRARRPCSAGRGVRAVVLLEAPHRIEALRPGAGRWADRPHHAGTRAHQAVRADCHPHLRRFAGLAGRRREPGAGRVRAGAAPVPLLRPTTAPTPGCWLLLAELPLKTAVRLAAEITGQRATRCTTPRSRCARLRPPDEDTR
jgi:16S rRNA (cytidine1402-2'-O)-methyltransferase